MSRGNRKCSLQPTHWQRTTARITFNPGDARSRGIIAGMKKEKDIFRNLAKIIYFSIIGIGYLVINFKIARIKETKKAMTVSKSLRIVIPLLSRK
jgi:hypothetical protein